MLKTAISHIWKITKITLSYCFLVLLLHSCISSYIGYNGYEKWKYRRVTYGERNESIGRNVFVKDLQYSSEIPLDDFNIYIEKGYKYGLKNSGDTRLVTNSKYPYQLSSTDKTGINNLRFRIHNARKYDSIDNMTIYLEKPYLKDTMFIGIFKYTTKWDSIGSIKVWDTDNK